MSLIARSVAFVSLVPIALAQNQPARYVPRDGVQPSGPLPIDAPDSALQAPTGGISTLRVSVDSAGRQGGSHSFVPALSQDGRYVAFSSVAGNLVEGDGNAHADIFVHDRETGATERVSVGPAGLEGNGDSLGPSISGDGRLVAFRSLASNLVPGDTNGLSDIFVHDRQTGATVRINLGPGGIQANGSSSYASIASDGRYVAFESIANDLAPGDTDSFYDVFRYDLQTGTLAQVSLDPPPGQTGFFGDCFQPSISADGRFVSFGGLPNTLLPVDVFLRDLQSATTEQVSLDPSGGDQDLETGPVASTSVSSVSADGRYVAFISLASDLVSGDTNDALDIFVRDRQAGITTRVSVDSGGAQGNLDSWVTYSSRYLSGDGRFVVFESTADDLVSGDTNGLADVFVHDRSNGATTRASVHSSGRQGNGFSQRPSISGDGLVVALESQAQNLVPGDVNGTHDAFVRVNVPGLPPITGYCSPKVNSHGCAPAIASSGVPSVAGSDAFFLTAASVLPHQRGQFLWSRGSALVPLFGGALCLASPLVRTPLQNSGGDPAAGACNGAYSFHFSQAYMAARGLTPGTTLYGQFLGHDGGFAPPNDVELTGGIRFTICP